MLEGLSNEWTSEHLEIPRADRGFIRSHQQFSSHRRALCLDFLSSPHKRQVRQPLFLSLPAQASSLKRTRWKHTRAAHVGNELTPSSPTTEFRPSFSRSQRVLLRVLWLTSLVKIMTITKNSYQNLLKIEDGMNRKKNPKHSGRLQDFYNNEKRKTTSKHFNPSESNYLHNKRGKKGT